MNEAVLHRRSTLDQPWLFPTAVASLVLGHAFDLIGTYVYQPNFEHESNPIYVYFKPHGLILTWPKVIAAKTILCLVEIWAFRFALTRRRKYYPAAASSFREMITHFLYGRPIPWFETLYRFPKTYVPSFLFAFIALAFTGPYFAYLGYDNLASHFGWPSLGGFYIGRYWIDYCVLIIWPACIVVTAWLLWDDFLASAADEFKKRGGAPVPVDEVTAAAEGEATKK